MHIWFDFFWLSILYICWFVWLRRISISTADGAILMAFGILINGAAQQIGFLKKEIDPYLAILLLALLLCLISSFIREIHQGQFYERNLKNPLDSFATCTWIAGISVTAISIVKELPELKWLAMILLGLNFILWAANLFWILRNYHWFYRQPKLINQIHGIILLACVATQSLVVAGNRVLGVHFPLLASQSLIIMGAIFYLLGFSLILIRYFIQHRFKDLPDTWNNTNCIIHGAVSITGLAIAVSHSIGPYSLIIIWSSILGLLILVETIELIRAVLRVRKYGWQAGLFVYSTSQWSRNFTLGMFLTFTMYLPQIAKFQTEHPVLRSIRELILSYGKFIIIVLFIIQITLFAKRFLVIPRKFQNNANQQISQ